MTNSTLHDETTFYRAFIRDLKNCRSEVIIESPFITSKRMKTLSPILLQLVARGVSVYIVTRDPKEHSHKYAMQSELEIQQFEKAGIQVLIARGRHHRKLAIIDRQILWEGSLNILSQLKSREIMRRINETNMAIEMYNFLKLWRYI